jgi:hypothetical protein
VSALRRATHWRLLLVLLGAATVPALLGALPLGLTLGAPLLHHPRGGTWTGELEGELLPDLARRLIERGGGVTLTLGLALALLAALALAPVATGATLAQVSAERRLTFRELALGAGAWWGRLVRLGLTGLIPLGVGGGLAGLAIKWATGVDEHAVTEAASTRALDLALGVGFAALFVALLTVDAGRAVLAAQPGRRSAFLAWTAGAWLTLRRPVRSLLAGGPGLVAGVLLALGLTALRTRLPPAALPFGLGLSSLAAVAVGWGRAVRLAALVELAVADAQVRDARRAASRAAAPPPEPQGLETPPVKGEP